MGHRKYCSTKVHRFVGAGIAGLIAVTAVPGYAATLYGRAVGSFANVMDGTGAGQWSISNQDDACCGGVAYMEWGNPTKKSSGLTNSFMFDGTASDMGSPLGSTSPDMLFSLGMFTYYNAQTRQDKVQGADFIIDLTIDGYTGTAPQLVFNMVIDNTHDSNDPIASADMVSIANIDDFMTPFRFTVDGVDYDFQLAGFSRDGGHTFEQATLSLENSATSAEIYAFITPVTTVIPVPGAMILFGSGLLGLLGAGSRRYRNQ